MDSNIYCAREMTTQTQSFPTGSNYRRRGWIAQRKWSINLLFQNLGHLTLQSVQRKRTNDSDLLGRAVSHSAYFTISFEIIEAQHTQSKGRKDGDHIHLKNH